MSEAPDRRTPLGRTLGALATLLRGDEARLRRRPGDLPSLLHSRLRTEGWSAEELARTFGFVTGETAAEQGDRDPVRKPPIQLGLWLDRVVRLSSGSGGSLPSPPGGAVTGALWLDEDRALSWSADGSVQLWDLPERRLVWSRRVHADAVTGAVLLEGQGERIATASRDGTVAIVELQGSGLRRLRGHTGPVLGVAVAPGVRGSLSPLIVSWSEDGELRLWDEESGEPRGTVSAHRGGLRCAVPHDLGSGAWRIGLATGGEDGSIQLWEVDPLREENREPAGFRLLAEAEAHRAPVTALFPLPRATTDSALTPAPLASGSEDTTVALWRPPDPTGGTTSPARLELVDRFEGHRLAVSTLAAAGGHQLVSGSLDRTLVLWRRGQEEAVARFEHHRAAITACTVVGTRLVSASADGTVGVRDLDDDPGSPTPTAASEAVRLLTGPRLAVRTLSPEPAGRRLLIGADDSSFGWADLAEGGRIELFPGRRPDRSRPVPFDDGRLLLCLAGTEARRVDVTSGEVSSAGPSGLFEGFTRAPGRPVARRSLESPSSRVVLWDRRSIEIWESARTASTAEVLERSADDNRRRYVAVARTTGSIQPPSHVALHPDGDWVATWGEGEEIEVFRRRGEKLVRAWLFRSHTDRVTSCRFLPDGSRLLSASWDGTLRLWRLDRPDFETLEGHTGRILACALDPMGRFALTAATDRTVRVWDLASLRPGAVAEEMPDLVTVLDMTGQWAAAGSADGRLVRIGIGGARLSTETAPAHDGPLHDLLFIHPEDGPLLLATCGDDGAVRTWEPGGELVGTAWADAPLRSLAWMPEIQRLVAQDEFGSLWSFGVSETMAVSGATAS